MPFALFRGYSKFRPSLFVPGDDGVRSGLTCVTACSITYTSLTLTKHPSPNSYANNASNWPKLIRAVIRYAKSLAVSELNLPIFLKLSAALNLLQAKPKPSHSPANWNSIPISCCPWLAKSHLNYKLSSVNDPNYSPTLFAP